MGLGLISNNELGRDGYPAKASDIFMCSGASSGVNTLLHVICADETSGVLVPIPQYPLYTATLSLLGATCVPYYLDSQIGWGVDRDTVKDAYESATGKGVDVRAIVVINPGNPTGAVLSEENIKGIIEFAGEKRLVIVADEVYQSNVFAKEFHSFKKVLRSLQATDPKTFQQVELASLHSVSKGLIGECGHRGGFFELVGFDPRVQAELEKFLSIMLCPSVIGQCLVSLMVNPPQKGDPSHEQFMEESLTILEDMKSRAQALHRIFSKERGFGCNVPEGSMYLFPSLEIPPQAAQAAALEGRSPDEFYCLKLLEATGVCVVPGSGFGQMEGSFHFRTTFLAPGAEWADRIIGFHRRFMDQYQ